MIQLTDAAQQRLAVYLQQVRFVLRGASSMDADEVARDIREHVETELGEAAQPVSFTALNRVLERLGKPMQWISVQEVPWWRRIMLHMRFGPHEWSLAYISFGLLVVGLLALPAGFPGLVLMTAGFLAARATVAVAAEEQQALGAQRWMVYPALLVTYLALGAVALGWAALVGAAIGDQWFDVWMAERNGPQFTTQPTAIVAGMTAALGLWWMLLGMVLMVQPEWLKFVFYPFGQRINRRWCTGLIVLGVVLCAVGAAVALLSHDPGLGIGGRRLW